MHCSKQAVDSFLPPPASSIIHTSFRDRTKFVLKRYTIWIAPWDRRRGRRRYYSGTNQIAVRGSLSPSSRRHRDSDSQPELLINMNRMWRTLSASVEVAGVGTSCSVSRICYFAQRWQCIHELVLPTVYLNRTTLEAISRVSFLFSSLFLVL